jgi:pSer/pThr/pTyr-binding forkhead associated (FHA) protein
MSFITQPIVILTATVNSFSFRTKYMPLALGTKVILGSANDALSRWEHPTNGWFADEDLLLSSTHAQLTCHHGQVSLWVRVRHLYSSALDMMQVSIRNLDETNAIFVNDIKISGPTVLRTGDIVVCAPH